jgi:hypothetical protein
LIKSNEETLRLAADAGGDRVTALKKEIEILSALLPKGPSIDDIVALLEPEHAAIKAAKAEGQAIGVAMKHLKQAGKTLPGNDVGAAVKRIRG